MADDFGRNDVGCRVSEIHTPVMDSLAATGIKLNNYLYNKDFNNLKKTIFLFQPKELNTINSISLDNYLYCKSNQILM